MSKYSGWNYRIIKHTYQILGEDLVWYAIHEVYYSRKTKKPVLVTVEPCHPQGETLEELKSDMAMFNKAFEKEVLDEKIFERKTKVKKSKKG